MKRMIIVISSLLLLTACFYDEEAKYIKDSERSQAEIVAAIKEEAEEKFGIEVNVDVNKLRFTFPEGKLLLPIITDKRLVVPVETAGTPPYKFDVHMSIYDEEKERYQFNKDEIELNLLHRMREYLLTDIFDELYEKELDELVEFDKGVKIELRLQDKLTNTFYEDDERDELLMDFAEDYHAGKFDDPVHYRDLLKKYTRFPEEASSYYEEQIKGEHPCTPEIILNIEHDDEERTSKERIHTLFEYIESSETLPNGMYGIMLREYESDTDSKKEVTYESVIRCLE